MGNSTQIKDELRSWIKKMKQPPSMINRLSKKIQVSVNKAIPEKIHVAITNAIKQMTKTVLFGAEFTSRDPETKLSFDEREFLVKSRIEFYRNTAAAEGAITGAAGILIGLADFPLWLTLKMKMLFEIAGLYGRNTGDLKERIFLLYIFELTFSSQQHRNQIFEIINDWDNYKRTIPDDINKFDWRNFQQEYRDYIDIAKLLQLVPGIGAAVGAVVNHRLTNKLGTMAMNAYRLRDANNVYTALKR